MTSSHEHPEGVILIVDDNPINIDLLFTCLDDYGHKVLVAESGYSALSRVQYSEPDLILLDVMMPGLDGFEVCRRLKENAKTRDIPVIFLTALSESKDKVRGFQVGGVDYITKPIQYDELLARVSTHLTLRNLQKELRATNRELEERNEGLDAYARTIAHNLQSSLSVLQLYIELFSRQLAATDAQSRYISQMMGAVQRASQQTEDLLMLARIKDADIVLEPCDMEMIVQASLERIEPMRHEYRAEIACPNKWPAAWGQPEWIEEVWINYLSNAMKYGGNPPIIELGTTERTDGYVRFWVRDNGKGISEEARSLLFTEFTRLEPEKEKGTGLGALHC